MARVDARPRAAHGGAMVRALALSIGQLGDRAVLRVLAKSLGVTLALFGAVGAGLYLLLDRELGAPGWAGAVAVVASLGVAWLLFRVVAIAVLGVFGDEIVRAVEVRHYPAAVAGARTVGFGRSLGMGLGSAGRAIAVNLLLVPVYVASLFTAVGPAVLFFVANGWLLGRDLTDMVAARHVSPAMMRDWRRANRGGAMMLGLAATGLFVVPVLGLLAPVLGAAMATHWFHGRRR